jgi:hypothetical protein
MVNPYFPDVMGEGSGLLRFVQRSTVHWHLIDQSGNVAEMDAQMNLEVKSVGQNKVLKLKQLSGANMGYTRPLVPESELFTAHHRTFPTWLWSMISAFRSEIAFKIVGLV